MNNIKYVNDQFVEYYSNARRTWDEFYTSEKYMFEKILGRFKKPFSVLDVGCGCGGLGNALSDKFLLSHYRGLDINAQQIQWAVRNSKIPVPCEFVCEDIATYVNEDKFDAVISLSCVDYNIAVKEMIENAWEKVSRGGYFIASIRLTTEESINDIERAFQYINYGEKIDKEKDEIANYVVFNLMDILGIFSELKLRPDMIEAYGYWCKPSKTAVVEYDELCMSVFALHKPENNNNIEDDKVKVVLDLPNDFFIKQSGEKV